MLGTGRYLTASPLPHHRAYGPQWVKLGREHEVEGNRARRSSGCAVLVERPGVLTCARTPGGEPAATCSSPVSRPQSRKFSCSRPASSASELPVAELRGAGKPLVKRPADNPVMVDQPQSFVRDELFKLVFGRSGSRHIARAGFGGNVVRPMPAQCVIVDVKFTSGSLDRGTGRQKPLDPHALEMITALASDR